MAKGKRKIVFGLIGGMGSGKSTVAAQFQERGAKVISGDQLGHEALRQPDIRDRVVGRWGTEVLDASGAIDRQTLGKIVFADEAELRALEALLFPWIERRSRGEIAAADTGVVVLDAAVLLEAGWNRLCDSVVYVHAPRPLRLRRLAGQRGWKAEEVEARERLQMSLTEKVSLADAVIDNSGSPEDVARQVDDLLHVEAGL
jgi:dephospho-CoA kinase